ncbi:hypothetical protein AB0L79_16450 [Streptomyces tendae]|uniref:hypothetical protein n=1 Tax=Streptomyces tendae TaxID=1932 RepID=UPI00343DB204
MREPHEEEPGKPGRHRAQIEMGAAVRRGEDGGSRKPKDREHPLPYTTASVKDAESLPKERMPGFAVTAPRARWR